MKKFSPKISLLFALSVLLTACSGYSNHTAIDALNEAKPVGSTFTQDLAAGYKDFANSEQNKFFDYADALHFAKKGLLAAEGKNVLPEPLANWQLDQSSSAELGDARMKLMAALDGGGRAQKPSDAANVQLKFDCWIEQQEESIFRTPSCKAEFYNALDNLTGLLKNNQPDSPRKGQPIPAQKMPAPMMKSGKTGLDPMATDKMSPLAPVISEQDSTGTGSRIMDEGMFLVFYDFNKSNLTESGQQVMEAVAKQLKARKDVHNVTITGFTDTSGGTAYNRRLSQRRAEAVRKALVKLGVSDKLLTVKAMGETQLMVKTPDNTREPANRRAEIHFD